MNLNATISLCQYNLQHPCSTEHKLDKLRALCREHGLPVSGRKADLLTRLTQADRDSDESTHKVAKASE